MPLFVLRFCHDDLKSAIIKPFLNISSSNFQTILPVITWLSWCTHSTWFMQTVGLQNPGYFCAKCTFTKVLEQVSYLWSWF